LLDELASLVAIDFVAGEDVRQGIDDDEPRAERRGKPQRNADTGRSSRSLPELLD
jgi:hypothetical protein